MPKCPRCSSRKAKRDCPALQEAICPQCCADGRLREITCPQTCTYLASEFYQHKRRRERASSQGRRFLETTRTLFSAEDAADFAFKLQADIYFFLRRETDVDDATIVRALEGLKGTVSRIVVPASTTHPLERFLQERMSDPSRYPTNSGLDAQGRSKVLRDLARHVASLGGEGTHRYRELIASFFDELDFEADLDYSPLDAANRKDEDSPRSPGGLILPFSGGS